MVIRPREQRQIRSRPLFEKFFQVTGHWTLGRDKAIIRTTAMVDNPRAESVLKPIFTLAEAQDNISE